MRDTVCSGIFMVCGVVVLCATVMIFMTGCTDSSGGTVYIGGSSSSEPEDERSAEEIAFEKAQEVVDRVRRRRNEAHQAAEEAGDFSGMFGEVDKILREECGFRSNFLSEVIFEEYLNNTPRTPEKELQVKKLGEFGLRHIATGTFEEVYVQYNGFLDPILTEYLKMSFLYPDVGEGEILERYRESIQGGEVNIHFPD